MKVNKYLFTTGALSMLAFACMSFAKPLSDNPSLIYGKNLISNGNFEKSGGEYVIPASLPQEGSVISGMAMFFAGDSAPVATKDPLNENNTVLRCKQTTAAFSNFFKLLIIESGATYKFSFDFKVEGTTDNIGFGFYCITDKNRLPEVNIMDPNQQGVTITELENGWKRATVERTFDENKQYDSIQFWNNCGSSTNYFDNFSLVKVGTETNIFTGGDFEGFLDYAPVASLPETPNEDGLYGINAALGNKKAILTGESKYGAVVGSLSENNYQFDLTINNETYASDANLMVNFLKEDNTKLFEYSVIKNGVANESLKDGTYTTSFEGNQEATKVELNYKGSEPLEVSLFSLRATFEQIFNPEITYYEGENMVVNGDFEAFETGTKLSQNQLEGAWGSLDNYDNPGEIVEEGGSKAVRIGKASEAESKAFSSFFLMTPDNIAVGDLIRFKYDYKLTTTNDSMTYPEINTCFVGGANQSYYLVDLRQLAINEDYKLTSGVEDIHFPVKYERLENDFIRVTMDFQVSMDKISWNSIRWLFGAPQVGDSLIVDNVELRYLTDKEPTNEITKLEITDNDLELNVGDTKKLSVNITPTDATNKDLTWTSSNESVATVNNGEVKALKEGSTEITVTSSNGIKDSIIVTVLEKAPVTPEPEKNNGCGGSIVATSLVLSSLALATAGLTVYLNKKRKK